MDMHRWWDNIDTGGLQYFEENLPPEPLCLVQIPHGSNPSLRGERTVTPPEPCQCLICDVGNEIPDFTFSIPPTADAIAVTQPTKCTHV